MHAIILATNTYSEFDSLAANMSPALLPLLDRPVIAVMLEILVRAGIKRILVTVCSHTVDVMTYLGDGQRWGIQIDYLMQPVGHGAAQALQWLAPRLRETTLVVHGDSVLDLDIAAAVDAHRIMGGAATQIVQAQSGEATGAFLLEPEVAHLCAVHAPHASTILAVLQAAGIHLEQYATADYYSPIATPADYHATQRVFLYSAVPAESAPPVLPRLHHVPAPGRQIAPGVWAGRGSLIDPSAVLVPPVYVGEESHIGRAVELGPETVIGAHVVIDDEATVRHSIVLDHTYIGGLLACEQRIASRTTVIDPVQNTSVEIADPLLLDGLPARSRSSWRRWLLHRAVAATLLIALLPLLLVIGVLVLLLTGKSPLTTAPRVVRRTQTDDTLIEAVLPLHVFATLDATHPRSAIGRLLLQRKLRYLPALWNVLRGDLDLVGVKPRRPHKHAVAYASQAAADAGMVAGLTGLWYVHRAFEDEANMTSMLDAYYAATYTCREDIRILAQTARCWLQRWNKQPRPLFHEQITPLDSRIRTML